MSLTRRMLALLMAVLMTISLFPLQTFAADGEEPDPPAQAEETTAESGGEAQETVSETDVPEPEETDEVTVIAEGAAGTGTTYVLTSDGTLTFSGSGTVKSYSDSPSPWYQYSSQIRSIVLETGISQLGGGVYGGLIRDPFYGLSSVKEITFLGVTCPTLNSYNVLMGLSTLERVFVPTEAFSNYTSQLSGDGRLPTTARIFTIEESEDFLVQNGVLIGYQGNDLSITIPNGVTEIGTGAFLNCKTLNELEIPDSVTKIRFSAFCGCSGLTGNLTIPDSVTVIESRAFYGCSGFDGALRLPNSIKTIGNACFSNCHFTGPLVIPDSVTAINEKAFENMSGITSVTFGAQLSKYYSNSFTGCSSVQEVTFTGLTVPTVGGFPGGSSLKTIYVPSAAYQDYAKAFGSQMPSGAVLRCTDYSGDFLVDDGALIAYFGEAEEVVFPTDVLITEIADGAFQNLKTAKSVVIPEGVTKIGANAFKGCTSLTEITLPSTLTQIGSEAFSGCVSLASVALPEGLTSLGEKAFYQCSALSGTVSVPGGVKTIPAYAFYGCSALTGLTLAEGIQSIGDYAFYSCSKLSGTLSIPGSVATIGKWAFGSCASLTELRLTDGLKTIYQQAFRGCSGLTGVLTIPNSVTSIQLRAFYECKMLTGLVLSESMTLIDSECFYGCSGLSGELVIPDSVTYIGEQAFRGCSKLTSIVFGAGVTLIQGTSRGQYSPFTSCGSITELSFRGTTVPTVKDTGSPFPGSVKTVFVPEEAYDAYVAAYQGYLSSTARFRILGSASDFMIEDGVLRSYIGEGGDVVIPEGVTEIAENAFKNVKTITSVTFPSTLQIIGDSAFYYCSGLTGSLVIPDGVTTIGDSAFYYCTGLTGLELGENLETIGANAFYQCKGLTGSLVIPNKVTAIGDSAFNYCTGLNGSLTLSESLESIGVSAFYYCSGLTGELVIPDRVTTIEANAFSNMSGITSVVFGSNVTQLQTSSFSGCTGVKTFTYRAAVPLEISPLAAMTNLERVYVPNEGYSAYADALSASLPLKARLLPIGVDGEFWTEKGELLCYLGSASEVTIPDTVTKIGPCAFRACSFLTKVHFPEELTSIGKQAFYNCTGLTDAPVFPDGLKTIGSSAFKQCNSMTGILVLPDGLTTLGASAFSGCARLTGLRAIPDGVTTIADSVFYQCTGLSGELRIPDGVTRIGYGAFYNCGKLTKLTLNENLTSIGDNAF